MEPWLGNISLRLAVFARDGRGGGLVPDVMLLWAAKGSLSMFFGPGALSLRGGALCREFLTLGGEAAEEDFATVGETGGGGAARDGTNESVLDSRAAALRFAW